MGQFWRADDGWVTSGEQDLGGSILASRGLAFLGSVQGHSSPSTTALFYYEQDIKNMRSAMEKPKPEPDPEPVANVQTLKVLVG